MTAFDPKTGSIWMGRRPSGHKLSSALLARDPYAAGRRQLDFQLPTRVC
jgi:hypothetical protein